MTAAELRALADLAARLSRTAQATTRGATLTTIALAAAELAEVAAGAEVVPALEDVRQRLELQARVVATLALRAATRRSGVWA